MTDILVVVDVQNDFVTGSLGTAEAEAVVGRIVSKIEGFDGRVVYTMDSHGDDYLDTQEGRRLPTPHCIRGTWGWENPSEVTTALKSRKAVMYEKSTFASLELASDPLVDGAGTVELVGLCTDICVISNALTIKAHHPETEVRVDPACCAGSNPEMHRAALDVMRSCQILIG